MTYNVGENDTLSGIAANYNVSVDTLKAYNGLTSNNIYSGQSIVIPLCERLPTEGPTPTATNPPPYAATNLLLPADGAVFTGSNDSVTLQWAASPVCRQAKPMRSRSKT
jgi:LysM repeat protein